MCGEGRRTPSPATVERQRLGTTPCRRRGRRCRRFSARRACPLFERVRAIFHLSRRGPQDLPCRWTRFHIGRNFSGAPTAFMPVRRAKLSSEARKTRRADALTGSCVRHPVVCVTIRSLRLRSITHGSAATRGIEITISTDSEYRTGSSDRGHLARRQCRRGGS